MVVNEVTYGSLEYDYSAREYVISKAEAHVCMRLKQVFAKIPTHQRPPYRFKDNPHTCADLEWFMVRYPMFMSDSTRQRIAEGSKKHTQNVNEIEAINGRDYVAPFIVLKDGFSARPYQVVAQESAYKVNRLLLADDLGLGKTLSSILLLLKPGTLPAAVVVQTHMPKQWQVEGVELFTNLKVHIIKGTKPYELPPADVYIFKYSCLVGWVDTYSVHNFKTVIFDECQEFRCIGSGKYNAGKELADRAQFVMGLSATPIFNLGSEIWNVMNVIRPDSLGEYAEFTREWCTQTPNGKYRVTDPQALGSYLREMFLMLRRTRADVGMELPKINKIVHVVDYDHAEVKKHESLARILAMKVVSGSFEESGQAARELDMLARQTTGVSKARYVAEYVRILLENGYPVLLAAWHRAVYAIFLEELKEFNPVMYTGSESAKQKDRAKEAFISGETKLFIISLRSGSGLDGLQYVCSDVVIGELDWSPKVIDQLIGRVDRPGRPDKQVTAHFLVSESGSDPVILNLLGLKSSQSHGIMDPLALPGEQFSDESRMKELAKQYLKKTDI